MPKYFIPWKIEGEKAIEAPTRAAAHRIFERMNVRDYVEEGELQSFDAKTVQEKADDDDWPYRKMFKRTA